MPHSGTLFALLSHYLTIKRNSYLWPTEVYCIYRPSIREKEWQLFIFHFSLSLCVGIQVNAWLGRNYSSCRPYPFDLKPVEGRQHDPLPSFLSFTCAHSLFFTILLSVYLLSLCWGSPEETWIILLLFHCPWVGPVLFFCFSYFHSLPLSLFLCHTLSAVSHVIRMNLSSNLLYRKEMWMWSLTVSYLCLKNGFVILW